MRTNNIYYTPLLLITFLLCSCDDVFSQDEFEFVDIATGLDTPWEILWGPDNYIWVTERFGRISRVNPETSEIQHLITISDVFMRDQSGDAGERGLMGMALHPDFEENPYLYTIYNYGDRNNTRIKLVRYEYDDKTLKSPITLLENIKGAWNHNGARIIIDDDLTMYLTMGDAAETRLAQDLSSLNGKILRLNLDGTIPSDNPFPNSYIWSWGHRNPQGLVKANGKLYSSEHGPGTDDELNIILKGRNYGWPTVNGYCDKSAEMKFCQDSNVVEPMLSMNPQRTYAVCGIDYYNNNAIPVWKNSILVTCLKDARIVQAKLNETGDSVVEEKFFFNGIFGRLRDICVSPDGRVFISTSNKDGRGNPKQNDDRIIEVKMKSSSSGNNITPKNDFNVSPNPAYGFIKFSGYASFDSAIDIYDNFGKHITKLSTGNSENFEIIWNGNNDIGVSQSAGIYNAILNTKFGTKKNKHFILIK